MTPEEIQSLMNVLNAIDESAYRVAAGVWVLVGWKMFTQFLFSRRSL